MNYTKYEKKTYNLHVIKTERFKTNMIKINFKRKLKKEDITYSNLLTKILLHSNSKYKTKRDLEIKTEDLYNLSMSATVAISGNYLITTFNGIFLKEHYTEENMDKKSIEFIFDILFNPSISESTFNEFELAKRLVSEEISTIKDNPKNYANLRMLENLDDKRPHNSIGYIEDLKIIKNKNLYNYYKELLKTSIVDVFLIGDIEDDTLETIDNLLDTSGVLEKKEPHFVTYNKTAKVKTVIENHDVEQAKLVIGFKLNNLTDKERQYVINMYSYILGGSPDSKLFKNVREKNSLCYYINASAKQISNILVINAGIDKRDFKKCLSLIKKEIKNMSKGEFSKIDLEAAKITYINSLKDIEDFQVSILKMYESYQYLNFDLPKKRIEEIINVTKEDVINISKKITLDTIYLLEGEENED